MESNTVPLWLKTLLTLATLFTDCEHHSDEFKGECNMFCFNCSDKAMCIHCIQSSHKDHKFIQIRRSSYHNVVKVSDIENELDVTGIQIYVINSFDVVYLNKRDMDEPKGKRTGKRMKHSSQCETCRRNISDTYQFCSLGCKYAWVHKSESESEMSGSGSAVLGTNKGKEKLEEEEEEDEEEEITKALSSSQEDQKGSSEKNLIKKSVSKSQRTSTNLQLQPKGTNSSPRKNKGSSNSNKRKGIPYRAPFF